LFGDRGAIYLQRTYERNEGISEKSQPTCYIRYWCFGCIELLYKIITIMTILRSTKSLGVINIFFLIFLYTNGIFICDSKKT
jgi:hypothetical protein